jgi:flagellar biosynthesis GTPase FlhF
MVRKIKKAKISFISLVPAGANKMPVIYKEDGTMEMQTLSKMQEDGELLAVVYVPGLVDADGDYADAKVIKEMAHDFLQNSRKIDLRHNGQSLSANQAYLAESFIVAKGDERFKDFKDYDGNPVDVTGSWAVVIKVEDPELRKLYREGQWNGVSMFGRAEVVNEKAAKPGFLKSLFGKKPEVKVDELKDMLVDLTKRLTALEADKEAALEKQRKELEEKKEKELKDLKEEVTKLRKELEEKAKAEKAEKELANLEKILKESKDEKEKKAAQAKIEELKKAQAPQTVEAKLAELEKELAELQKRSNQPKEEEEKFSVENTTLSKEDLKLVELGRKMAKLLNEEEEK